MPGLWSFRVLINTLTLSILFIDNTLSIGYYIDMSNELIFDEALGEWIDPEAIRAEGEALETAARWEAADLAEAQRARSDPEEGDYL